MLTIINMSFIRFLSFFLFFSFSSFFVLSFFFNAARSFCTLRVQVVLGPSCSRVVFGLFHSSAVSLLLPAKLSDNHPLEKIWQRDRINLAGLNEWKYCLGVVLGANCSPFFNSVPFLEKCSKVPTEKYTFSTTKNILDLFKVFFYCQI